MKSDDRPSRLELSLAKFAEDPAYNDVQIPMQSNQGTWQVSQDSKELDDVVPQEQDIYGIPTDRSLQQQLKSTLKLEQRTRLRCSKDVLTVTEKLKGWTNYAIGRRVVAPTIAEVAKRQYQVLCTMQQKMDASFRKVEDNTIKIQDYLEHVIDKVVEHDVAYQQANQQRLRFRTDLDEHKQNIIDATGYSVQRGQALKMYFRAQNAHLKATRDSIRHLSGRNFRESEMHKLKDILDSSWAVLIRGSEMSAYAEVLTEHMKHVNKTYELIIGAVQDAYDVNKYIKETSNNLVHYQQIVQKVKGLMVLQTRERLSEEGRDLYRSSGPE